MLWCKNGPAYPFHKYQTVPGCAGKKKARHRQFGGENAPDQMIVFVLKFHDGSLRFAFS